jgi:hypothetical protein
MLRALGPRAQSVRLLTSHCVTCMSSPTARAIDRRHYRVATSSEHLSQLKRCHRVIMPVPVGTGWTIDADPIKRSEGWVGGVLCDEVRTNQARSPGAIKGLASRD